jgi:hypothetical protein
MGVNPGRLPWGPPQWVPVPDGTETQEMCPREFPLFPVFRRFPQYYGFRKYVYCFRNIFTVSEIYLTYPGVGSFRGDPRRLRGDPQPPGASCHAVRGGVRLWGPQGESPGAVTWIPPLWKTYNNISNSIRGAVVVALPF